MKTLKKFSSWQGSVKCASLAEKLNSGAWFNDSVSLPVQEVLKWADPQQRSENISAFPDGRYRGEIGCGSRFTRNENPRPCISTCDVLSYREFRWHESAFENVPILTKRGVCARCIVAVYHANSSRGEMSRKASPYVSLLLCVALILCGKCMRFYICERISGRMLFIDLQRSLDYRLREARRQTRRSRICDMKTCRKNKNCRLRLIDNLFYFILLSNRNKFYIKLDSILHSSFLFIQYSIAIIIKLSLESP